MIHLADEVLDDLLIHAHHLKGGEAATSVACSNLVIVELLTRLLVKLEIDK